MKKNAILLVEDDRAFRKALAFELEGEGFAVTEASDGAEAIGLLKTENFDFVISDVMMPGASGLEVYASAMSCQPRPGFIAISAYDESETAQELAVKLEERFFKKPFELSALIAKIKEDSHDIIQKH